MAITATLACRWLRRYKAFFILGLVIIVVQVILAYKSQSLSTFQTAATDDEAGKHPQHSAKLHFHESDDEDSASNSYAKSKSVNGTTQAKKLSSLRLESLNFTPACEIVTREAISAIHRARTTTCKKQIADTACAIQEERFYAKQLPNSCPNQGRLMERPMGCYQDEKKYRILSGYYMNFKTNNSPNRCIQMCLQSGFLYAGVQYSTECFCGNDPPKVEAKLPDPSCNLKCPGDAKQTCGGYFTTNVYETGITKFTAQVAEVTTKAGDVPVRIVFLLTLNGRAVRQVHRLLKALYSRDHFYYIHVDSRQDYLYRELKKLEKHAPNIRLATKRFSTIWGGASLLQMLLASMRDLLLMDHWTWDFVINLSESDFPVKPIEKLIDFLTANRGRNFVKSHGREVQRFIQKQGLDKTFVECDTHMWRIGDRELPNGIQIDGGSDWVALSRDFVTYVTAEETDELLDGLSVVFRHTLLPAESFFHTALRNSRFCGTYVDNNLHVTNWKRRLGCKCQYKHVVDWCGCSPNDFKPDDWPRLLGTEGKQLFFARKFEPIVNQAILLRIEEWLYGPYPNEYPNLNKYWQSIYSHLDFSPKPDAGLLTIVNSLVAINGQNNSHTKYVPLSVKEVTTLMDNDEYNGFLIHHSGKVGDMGVEFDLETWVRPNQHAQVSKVSNIARRIKVLEVTSEYDQKEQLGRNYGKFLSASSEPVLVFKVISIQSSKQASANLTVLWVDPRGMLADVSEVYIEDVTATSINFAKQTVKHPLIAGAWHAKLIHKKVLIAQCSYLVTPLNAAPSKPIKFNEVASADWKIFLPTEAEQKIFVDKFEATSTLTGDNLNAWIRRLVNKFYVIRSTCVVRASDAGHLGFAQCDGTEWSSFISDPKSDIITELRNVQAP